MKTNWNRKSFGPTAGLKKVARCGLVCLLALGLSAQTPQVDSERMAQEYAADANVEFAEPNLLVTPSFVPNDIQCKEEI